MSAVFDLDLISTVAGKGLAPQAQVKGRAVHHKIAVDGGILRKVDISRLICIINGVRSVPRRESHSAVRGVIADIDRIAADAMLVYKCPVSVEGVILAACHGSDFFNLCAAVLLGEPALKAVVQALRHR